MQGRKLMETNASGDKTTISLREYNTGTYLLRVQEEKSGVIFLNKLLVE
jgi:hypothetical protein